MISSFRLTVARRIVPKYSDEVNEIACFIMERYYDDDLWKIDNLHYTHALAHQPECQRSAEPGRIRTKYDGLANRLEKVSEQFEKVGR